jgi:hypothetical protein
LVFGFSAFVVKLSFVFPFFSAFGFLVAFFSWLPLPHFPCRRLARQTLHGTTLPSSAFQLLMGLDKAGSICLSKPP